jgi:predicted nucleic acid-binding Zn finger protein
MISKDKNTTLRSLDQITINADPSNLAKIFGPRFHKAWKLLIDKKLVKYIFRPSGRAKWIVEGGKRDYMILKAAGYCECPDLYYGVVYGKAQGCQHLITQRLGEALGDYIVREVEDSLFSKMMDGWRKYS